MAARMKTPKKTPKTKSYLVTVQIEETSPQTDHNDGRKYWVARDQKGNWRTYAHDQSRLKTFRDVAEWMFHKDEIAAMIDDDYVPQKHEVYEADHGMNRFNLLIFGS